MLLSRYEWVIAKRYLLPGKGEGFIFLVASIRLVAVMLGVAALIVVMSVMNGFRAELFDKIVGLNGHAVVQGYGGRLPDWRDLLEDTRNTKGVVSASPMIEQPLLDALWKVTYGDKDPGPPAPPETTPAAPSTPAP